jgi:hypothetical protein
MFASGEETINAKPFKRNPRHKGKSLKDAYIGQRIDHWYKTAAKKEYGETLHKLTAVLNNHEKINTLNDAEKVQLTRLENQFKNKEKLAGRSYRLAWKQALHDKVHKLSKGSKVLKENLNKLEQIIKEAIYNK